MQARRVLVLTQMYPRRNEPTHGIFIHRHVRELMSVGCEVKAVCPVPYAPSWLVTNRQRRKYSTVPRMDRIDEVEILYPRYFRPPGRRFHPVGTIAMSKGDVARAVSQLVKSWKPDLLHAHTATPAGYPGVELSRRHNLPVVLHLRGSDINVYPFRDRWTMRLTKHVLTRADLVLAVSSDLAEQAMSMATPRRPIETVHTGCDLNQFSKDEDARAKIRQQLGIPSNHVVLIFVGNLLREKGTHELMSAFCQLIRRGMGHLHLVLVGEGEQRQRLEAAAIENTVHDRTHVVGRVAHADVPGWLNAGDIFVLPSWHEGLPNAAVEAMSCELPVVASRVGGIPEAVDDGVSGVLIREKAPNELADALANLIEDEAARKRMGQAGRIIVERRFSWPRNAEQTMRIYEKVLRER